ncbi:DNA modification methylase [Microbacterium sp.]|uniref:DNA modification methylase n=1 Tax=Microbacterium sp. TaxID=51671 RepID=UPI00261E6DDE|nr:DNA modification methylase [Microbacterium sp.]
MKSRLVASAALSALVLLGATGCTFITPQSTEIAYSASDGVNIADTEGPLEVRNALVVATEDGSTGNLVAAIVNPTEQSATLTVEIEGLAPLTVRVGAGDTLSLGSNAEPVLIEGLDTMPGATVEMYFQSGDATGAAADVPVLDGTLPYYADLVPTPVVTPGTVDEPAA